MSFLDIRDPAKRATLVKEYVTSMKTVKQRNMVNREMKLAIGDELQTLFHPIVNATKQAAEEAWKEPAPMKKTLTDISRALNHTAESPPEDYDFTFEASSKPLDDDSNDITFRIYTEKMGNYLWETTYYSSMEMF